MDPTTHAAWIGAGGAVVGGVLGAVIGAYIQRNRPPKPRAFLQERTPAEIRAAIDKAPLAHRQDYGKSVYVGRWVKWSGSVAHAQYAGPFFQVMVSVGGDRSFDTILWYPRWSRRKVEHLREGDSIAFVGRLRGTSGMNADVWNAQITAHQSAPSTPPQASVAD